MTYFGFLFQFVGIPLILLTLVALWDTHKRKKFLPESLQSWPFRFVLIAHVIVAVVYTTPWDNYLVATGVWWYDPQLVTGVVFGWVPVEEYTFFVLQTIMTGLWILFICKREQNWATSATNTSVIPLHNLRYSATAFVGIVWIISVWMLFGGWKPGTYLALELSWALLPIMLQLALGADILWHYRWIVLWSWLPPTVYLSIGDAIAIESGTWTIDPAQSTGILVGTLPVEELLFFGLTNLLVVFGVILVLEQTSQERAPKVVIQFLERFQA